MTEDPTAVDIAWLTGLFEGEGCLTFDVGGRWELNITSTDLDVLTRASVIGEAGRLTQDTTPHRAQPHWKATYRWRVRATGDVLRIATMLRPLCGQRRQARIDELLAWDAAGRPFIGSQSHRDRYNANRQTRRAARIAVGQPAGG